MAEKLSRRKAMGLMGAAAAMAGLPSHVIWGQRGSYGGSTGQERGEMGRIAAWSKHSSKNIPVLWRKRHKKGNG